MSCQSSPVRPCEKDESLDTNDSEQDMALDEKQEKEKHEKKTSGEAGEGRSAGVDARGDEEKFLCTPCGEAEMVKAVKAPHHAVAERSRGA